MVGSSRDRAKQSVKGHYYTHDIHIYEIDWKLLHYRSKKKLESARHFIWNWSFPHLLQKNKWLDKHPSK